VSRRGSHRASGWTSPPSQADERGFALVIVLWIFIVLFVLGAEFSQAMRQDAAATSNFADETQSYYLASAAANLTFYRALRSHQDASLGRPPLEEQEEGSQPPLVEPDGEWHPIEVWGAQVWVKVADEGAKIPLNWADEAVLGHLLTNLGVPPEEVSEIADSILDWRDKDDEHRLNGAETDYYQSLPTPYVAKNAPFDSLEELLLVKGVTRELYDGGTEDFPIGLREVLSVFSPRKKLNVQNASPEVLRAFFGLDEEELAQLLEVRDTSAPGLIDVLRAKVPDPRLSEMLTSETAPTLVSVEVQAQVPASRIKAHMAAVIDLGESTDGIYILRWMDQLPPVETS
jgi:general secretion pathway protein K